MWAFSLTSQIKRKSCCSTRNNSQVVFVTTVLSRGRSCKIDSPNVAPTPKLHSVTGLCKCLYIKLYVIHGMYTPIQWVEWPKQQYRSHPFPSAPTWNQVNRKKKREKERKKEYKRTELVKWKMDNCGNKYTNRKLVSNFPLVVFLWR